MPEMTKEQFLAQISKIQSSNSIDTNRITAIVMGCFGTGKTSIFKTCPKPVLLDMFDPTGYLVLKDNVEVKKDIIVRDWSNERWDTPTQYRKWEQQWKTDVQSGFLTQFSTYGIDSLTTMLSCMANAVSKAKGRPDGSLAIQDYSIIYNTLEDIVRVTSLQGCHFFLTGHLAAEKDELTGEITEQLDTYNKLRGRLPALFAEKWVMVVEGGKYKLLTKQRGRYRASTQIGGNGVFKDEEEPNVRELLKKAGYPYEDKQWR